jgi:hypothetical protein
MKFDLKAQLKIDFYGVYEREMFTQFSDLYQGGEIKRVFPLGGLRRIKGGIREELVDIQFNKYDSRKFVINFSVNPCGTADPADVLHQITRHLTASEVQIYYRVYASRFLSRWFSAHSESDYVKIRGSIVDTAHEIIKWFDGGPWPRRSKKIDLSP